MTSKSKPPSGDRKTEREVKAGLLRLGVLGGGAAPGAVFTGGPLGLRGSAPPLGLRTGARPVVKTTGDGAA